MMPSPLEKSLSQLCGDADLARTLSKSAEALGVSFVISDARGQRHFGSAAEHVVTGDAEGVYVRALEVSPSASGELWIVADFDGARLDTAGELITELIESAYRCQGTITGMAAEICDNYEELNLVYDLCPQIASKQDPVAIGQELVAQTADILACERVSLLCYNKEDNLLSVLASKGLPSDVAATTIPATGSVCEELLLNDELLVLADTVDHPHFQAMSKGSYDSTAFAIARMPLRLHGELVGLLTATERRDNEPFTAREGKLMMALATMGAITLQNSRLNKKLNDTFISVVQCLCGAVDAKDPYTHNHSSRVSALAVRIGKQLRRPPEALRELRLAALVHDVGKIGVPEAILCKPDRLDRDEWAIMQKHSEFGAKILSQAKELQRIALVVLYHHERYDGEGYPAGLKGEETPLHSRIISVADTFDAITTARSYRASRPPEAAIAEIKRCAGTQFDPAIVEAFLRAMDDVPVPEEHTCHSRPLGQT